jgi:hypothetical protein
MVSFRSIIFLLFIPAFIFGIFAVTKGGIVFVSTGQDNLRADLALSLTDVQIASPASKIPVVVVKNGTEIQLRLDRPAAQSVLFYAEGGFMAAPLYLGAGSPDGAGTWSYRFDTDANILPAGDYSVYAQVYENSGIYNTARAALFVGAPQAFGSGLSQALNDEVQKSGQTVAAGNKNIEENLNNAFRSISASSDEVTMENVRQFADAARAIEQFDFLNREKIGQSRLADEKIRSLEDEVVGLAADVLPVIKSDKLKKIAGLKEQRIMLESATAGISERIRQKEKEMDDILASVLLGAGTAEKEAVAREGFDKLEQSAAGQEREIIASQEILRNDIDNDDLNNILEIKAGTNPFDPDTDADGALDGDEITHNFNPFEPDEFSRSVLSDPRAAAPDLAGIYKVIRAVPSENGGIYFEGQGLPNAYLAVYVYSVPVVAMVKADAIGEWSYILDYPLPDGQHTVYAARVNSVGEVEARSEPLVFMKSGNGISMITSDTKGPASESIQKLKEDFWFSTTLAIIMAFIAALLVIGFASSRNREAGR